MDDGLLPEPHAASYEAMDRAPGALRYVARKPLWFRAVGRGPSRRIASSHQEEGNARHAEGLHGSDNDPTDVYVVMRLQVFYRALQVEGQFG